MAIFLTMPFGLLGYCLWSRGLRGLLLALGLGAALFAAASAGAAVAYYAFDEPLSG